MPQRKLLRQLITIFDESTTAYRRYLAAGKTFQFAQELKLHNSKALDLVKKNGSFFPADLQDYIQSLITHYTEWCGKWEKLAAEKEHQPGDVFVFANDITFPKKAAQNIEEAYRKLS